MTTSFIQADASPRLTSLKVGPVRALFISPHPDDATLAAGGLMQRIIRDGGAVWVAQMTGGDAFPKGVLSLNPGIRPTELSYRRYGSVREREAIHALRQLGVGRSRIRLLGFPDEGLCLLAGSPRPDQPPFISPYTKREAPPRFEQLIPGATYCREDLLRELAGLIEAVRPTLIVLPDSGDEHPDHCATHLLTHQALADAVHAGVRPPRVLHYLVHYPNWPIQGRADDPIEPPAGGRVADWHWRTLVLTAAERVIKRHALDTYRSQMLVMADFLKAFERPNELFIEGEPLVAMPCWCSGEDIAMLPGSR